MPLNSIPATTTVDALEAKRAAAAGKCAVDVQYWGGVVPGNTAHLKPLRQAGVLGFKCFLVPSGVDEFQHVTESDLRQAMPVLAELGVPLLVHAELPQALRDVHGNPRHYSNYLASRPHAAEDEAIALMIRLCREFRAPVHIVHLSSAASLQQIEQARAEGLPLTVETCPHYLYFEAESIADGATQYKCAPPVRDAGNRKKLWGALGRGLIDMVVSDHSPCPPPMKAGDFATAWGGISSLECALAAVWTEARKRGHGPERLAQWMSHAPARLAGLGARKGRIAVGYDADFVVWNPEARWECRAERLHQRHKVTPYAGMELEGVVEATYVAGKKVS
jgi:allantoinase